MVHSMPLTGHLDTEKTFDRTARDYYWKGFYYYVAFVKGDHQNWDLHMHEFRHAVNTATQATTKESPAFLYFGRYPRPVESLKLYFERRVVERMILVEHIEPGIWLGRLRRFYALRDLVAKHRRG